MTTVRPVWRRIRRWSSRATGGDANPLPGRPARAGIDRVIHQDRNRTAPMHQRMQQGQRGRHGQIAPRSEAWLEQHDGRDDTRGTTEEPENDPHAPAATAVERDAGHLSNSRNPAADNPAAADRSASCVSSSSDKRPAGTAMTRSAPEEASSFNDRRDDTGGSGTTVVAVPAKVVPIDRAVAATAASSP